MLRLNPLSYWTVSLARDLWPYMGVRSILRYRDYSVREKAGRLRGGELLSLRLKSPVRQEVYLREVGSDTLTFNEVLIEQVYGDVLRHVRGCRTILDLGANIGLASLYFAAHYPGSRVFAVEPNPDTYRLLEANLAGLVRAGRARTFRGAVWGSERELVGETGGGEGRFSRFATREKDDNAINNTRAGDARAGDGDHEAGAAAGGGGEAIRGLPIGRLIEEAGFERVDLLKSDTEGAEAELFKGDLGWLDKVGAVAIEFHGDSREATRFDEVMRARGFRVVDDGGHTVIAVKDGAGAPAGAA